MGCQADVIGGDRMTVDGLGRASFYSEDISKPCIWKIDSTQFHNTQKNITLFQKIEESEGALVIQGDKYHFPKKGNETDDRWASRVDNMLKELKEPTTDRAKAQAGTCMSANDFVFLDILGQSNSAVFLVATKKKSHLLMAAKVIQLKPDTVFSLFAQNLCASRRLPPQYCAITLGWFIFDQQGTLEKIIKMTDQKQWKQPSILVFEIQELASGSLQFLVLPVPKKNWEECYLQWQKVNIEPIAEILVAASSLEPAVLHRDIKPTSKYSIQCKALVEFLLFYQML